MKRLLMIAYHFPPVAVSSGVQRTLSFARHLPGLGWEPLILTVDVRAFERINNDQLGDVPPGVIVERAFALDSARHLAVRGRYPAFAARPDRWISWWLGAVPKGLAMIRKYHPDAIWSTYPIATAHKIGHTLHRLSGLPWVADFRDPMVQGDYPPDPKTRNIFRDIEGTTLRSASLAVFVTPGCMRFYREQYPDVPEARLAVVENGYDDEIFALLDGAPEAKDPLVPGTFTLLHSGVVYPNERDPTQLFRALRRMLDEGSLKPGELRVRFRASVHETLLKKLSDDCRLGDLVELAPPLPYRPALQEMKRADGLLVLQAANCNEQIPAKAYEYLRCRRPIIGLTDPAGDTANLLRRAGVRNIARLDSEEEIALELRTFLDQVRRGAAAPANDAFVTGASRLNRAREFAQLLEKVVAQEGAKGAG